jgi:hypothetical protein
MKVNLYLSAILASLGSRGCRMRLCLARDGRMRLDIEYEVLRSISWFGNILILANLRHVLSERMMHTV